MKRQMKVFRISEHSFIFCRLILLMGVNGASANLSRPFDWPFADREFPVDLIGSCWSSFLPVFCHWEPVWVMTRHFLLSMLNNTLLFLIIILAPNRAWWLRYICVNNLGGVFLYWLTHPSTQVSQVIFEMFWLGLRSCVGVLLSLHLLPTFYP